MPNVFITPQQVIDGMLKSAREQVATMPLEACRSLAEDVKGGGVGVSGAVLVCLIIAARERLENSTV